MTTQSRGVIEAIEDDDPLLIGDLFCGAGGSSKGCQKAVQKLGRRMHLVCVNHDKVAIATHSKNHPNADHWIEDLNGADPEKMVPGGYLDLLMASPECRWSSRARGGKPINDQLRMSAYAIQRWMTALTIRCGLIENVKEFIEWGPLCTLTPDHTGEHRHDPNNRPPLCLIPARRKGKPTSKPKCIHGRTLGVSHGCDLPDKRDGFKGRYFEAWLRNIWELGYDAEYRILTAADFGDATVRERFFLIFRKDGRPIRWPDPTHARPGTSGTMFDTLKPWRAAIEILDLDDHGRSLLDDPKYKRTPLSLPTRMRIAGGLMEFAGPLGARYCELLGVDPTKVVIPPGRGKRKRSSEYPAFMLSQQAGGIPRPLDEPVSTITGAGYITLIDPILLGQHTNNTPKSTRTEPVPTVMARAQIRLIKPMLVPYLRTSICQPVDVPLGTITTHDRMSLVTPLTIPYGPKANARSADQPLGTIMTRDRWGVAFPVADPFIVPSFGERPTQAPRYSSTTDPLPAITGRGAGRLAQPLLVETDLREVEIGEEVDPLRLVEINGQIYVLDIRFRMLKNTELARATSFDDDESQYEFVGTQTQITRQIGNAVPCRLAEALVAAILGPYSNKEAGTAA
jgi:DNA (cytosine-5)-methyltransferase 1